MGNYKIRVNNEARADEAKELFKKLGYHPDNSSYEPYVEWIAVFEDGSGSFYSHNVNLNDCVEITIAQLRDLVVLKRNDVKDATHFQTIEPDSKFFVTSNQTVYFFDEDDDWVLSGIRLSELTPITKPKNPALISGADALRALADGKEVEYFSPEYSKEWKSIRELTTGFDIGHFLNDDHEDDDYKFRLKPQTIKLELELPKPFEPKVGEIYWYLTILEPNGYDWTEFRSSEDYIFYRQIGAWRTEEEVKQVVEQLKKIKGAI